MNSDSEEEFDGFEDNEVDSEARGIVRQLEEQASMVAEKKPRKQSQREQEWCQRLVEKWGENFGKMARDRKLNPMQQTENDIARRIKKWQSEGGSEGMTTEA